MRQMRHGWMVSLLLALSIAGVVALYTYVNNSARFHNRSMQLIMKDTGHNLWFMSASANLLDIVSGSTNAPTIAADRIHSLSADRRVASTYWANVLQGRTRVRDADVLLTGLEVIDDDQVTEEKAHLFADLPPGTAALGYTLARDWDLKPGDTFPALGRTYQVQTVHTPNGTIDDTRLWVPLADAQQTLNLPGRANLILGYLCMQGRTLEAGIQRLQSQIAAQHADLQVIPLMNLLNARALARMTTSRYLHYLTGIIALITALMIAAVSWMEINERRYESAILMTMGASRGFLFRFFLAKLCLLAVIAATIGFLIGGFASIYWLSPVLVTHTQPVALVWSALPSILLRTLALTGLAAFFPLLHLARLDPTRILAEE